MLESMAEQSDQRSQLCTSAPVVESQPVVMLPEDVKLRPKVMPFSGNLTPNVWLKCHFLDNRR